MSEIIKLQPTEAYQKINEGAIFLDIIDEEGHSVVAYDGIESTQVTLLQLLEKLQWLDKAPMYIAGGYDEASGFKAANLLHCQGFDNVAYIAGGVQAWFQEGYQVKYNDNAGSGSCDSGGCGSGMDDEGHHGGCGGCSCGG